jgi:2'-5' RNA ligase
MGLRTFVAIELSDAVRTAIRRLIGELSQSRAKVKWVDPGAAHLTVKFLGNVEERQIHEVCGATSECVRQLPVFRLECSGVGAFPQLSRPRIIWIGIQDPEGVLAEMHSRLEGALAGLGFPAEPRQFRPHVTLGRLQAGGRGHEDLISLIQQRGDARAGSLDVAELVVFSSELTPTGPKYIPLTRCPLAG